MDLFTKRCNCGRILKQRESCPVCAARERERLHAKGVAVADYGTPLESTPVCWAALAWLGRRASESAACDTSSWAQMPAESGPVWAEPVQPKVPVWAQMPDTKKRFVSEAPQLDAYQQALKEAYRRDLEAPVSFYQPWSFVPQAGSIPCKCGGWITKQLLHEHGSCGPKHALVADGRGGLIDPTVDGASSVYRDWKGLLAARASGHGLGHSAACKAFIGYLAGFAEHAKRTTRTNLDVSIWRRGGGGWVSSRNGMTKIKLLSWRG